ncbi:MAG: hypothetical protein SV375_13330 [Thermodesulfobacteriota bacterium]|nr:hypothetical protein [Thermodesulfobacteriota bacterium]
MTPCLFCTKEIERLLKIKQAAERFVEATEIRVRLARETDKLSPMTNYQAWRKEWKHVTEEERGAYFDLRAKTHG